MIRLILALLLLPAAASADPVLQALDLELARATEALGGEDNPPYYIALEVIETRNLSMHGEEGGLQGYGPDRTRWVHADVRVGSPTLDSTHPLRDMGWDDAPPAGTSLGMADDPAVLRTAIWREIDARYRVAADRYQRVISDQQLLVSEDSGPDLAPAEPVEDLGPLVTLEGMPLKEWEEALRQASAVFASSEVAQDPSVSISANAENRWFISTDGHRLRHGTTLLRASISGDALAEDGQYLQLHRGFDAFAPEGLPDADALEAAARELQEGLVALRQAEQQGPFRGPAILSGRASAVFFHEIFGHRVEGSRLREIEDAQTFRHRVGEAILPPFLSVVDDPTQERAADVDLRGTYRFDDEGVPAERVTLVQDGVLEGFLESRSPVYAERSNAHGRRQAANDVISRQGNLMVLASRTAPDAELRSRLVVEAKKQGLEYGLYIDDIDGGFTFTDRSIPNAFQIDVIQARRIFVDGRPDEFVRGADLIGTPLQTFGRILLAGSQPEVFNGTCGAESGWVPVSATSPALLVEQIETQRKLVGQEKQPLLPAPRDLPTTGLQATLHAMAQRALTLRMPELPAPARVLVATRDSDAYSVAADFGSISRAVGFPGRPSRVEVVVGNDAVSSARIDGGGLTSLPDAIQKPRLVLDSVPAALSRDLWLASDASYKGALQRYAFKLSSRERMKDQPPPDRVPGEPVAYVEKGAVAQLDRPRLEALAARLSARLGSTPGLNVARVEVAETQGREHLVETDGTSIVQLDGYAVIHARVGTTTDGVTVQDERQWVARSVDHLPSEEALGAQLDALARSVAARASAKAVPWYEGPVVFEGVAAAQLFRYLLAPELRGTPPMPSGDSTYQQQIRGGARLGRRVLPLGWTLFDDPRALEAPLAGGYRYDREGNAAERVELVVDGRVRDFVMSEAPRTDLSGSNGHARGDVQGSWVGRLAHWTVAPKKALSEGAFTRKERALLRASGSERILVVRRFDRGWEGDLPRPTDAVWRSADGSEEPVLSLELRGVDRRLLRDVVAASGQQTLPYLAAFSPGGRSASVRGLPVTIVAPERVLVEEIEAVFPGAEREPWIVPPPPRGVAPSAPLP